MRRDLVDELKDIYYSEHADDTLRDWCFDSLCDDNVFLERSLSRSFETNDRWEFWAMPIAIGMMVMIGVATWAVAIA